MEYVSSGLALICIAVLVWNNYRLDKRLEDVLDRQMAMTDTLAQFKGVGQSDQFLFQDLETGEVTGLVRGSGASTEDVEGANV